MEQLSSNNNSSSKVKKELERMQGWWCFGNKRLIFKRYKSSLGKCIKK